MSGVWSVGPCYEFFHPPVALSRVVVVSSFNGFSGPCMVRSFGLDRFSWCERCVLTYIVFGSIIFLASGFIVH